MLCSYLVDIYKNHIQPNLIVDEILYSVELEMRILSLINIANDVKVRVSAGFLIEDKIRYYCHNDIIYYEIDSRMEVPNIWLNPKFFKFKEFNNHSLEYNENFIVYVCNKYQNKEYTALIVSDFTDDYLMDYNEYLKKYGNR
jgi:hypothetical protein